MGQICMQPEVISLRDSSAVQMHGQGPKGLVPVLNIVFLNNCNYYLLFNLIIARWRRELSPAIDYLSIIISNYIIIILLLN